MKFYGQYKLDKTLYERYFTDFSGTGVCLECGAVDGEHISSTKFFEETLGWQAINIEPHPNSFSQLIVKRPKAININLALSDEKGEAHLVTGKNFFLRAYLVKKCRKNTVVIQKGIYRDVVAKLPIDHIDLMVLDVEGHELSVIKGMVDAVILPKILCVEVNRVGRSAMKIAMDEMGYRFDSKININDVYIKI